MAAVVGIEPRHLQLRLRLAEPFFMEDVALLMPIRFLPHDLFGSSSVELQGGSHEAS